MVEGLTFVIIICTAIIIYMAWLIWHIQRVHEGVQRDLLDRIMSTNYATYVNGEVVREQAKQPPLPIYEEERGIPI